MKDLWAADYIKTACARKYAIAPLVGAALSGLVSGAAMQAGSRLLSPKQPKQPNMAAPDSQRPPLT